MAYHGLQSTGKLDNMLVFPGTETYESFFSEDTDISISYVALASRFC